MSKTYESLNQIDNATVLLTPDMVTGKDIAEWLVNNPMDENLTVKEITDAMCQIQNYYALNPSKDCWIDEPKDTCQEDIDNDIFIKKEMIASNCEQLYHQATSNLKDMAYDDMVKLSADINKELINRRVEEILVITNDY